MEGRIRIKRLTEQEDISDEDIQELGLQPSVADLGDIDTQLPAEGDSSADQGDVMVLTVADFLEKCRAIDPLVCMGITAFIENNADEFGNSEGSEEEEEEDHMDGAPSYANIDFRTAISDEEGGGKPGINLDFPKH